MLKNCNLNQTLENETVPGTPPPKLNFKEGQNFQSLPSTPLLFYANEKISGFITQYAIKCLFIQGDQLNMILCFWYLLKSDLYSVHVYSIVHCTSHFLQGTRKTRPCLNGHPVVDVDPDFKPNIVEFLRDTFKISERKPQKKFYF